jgi:hypothetical protein
VAAVLVAEQFHPAFHSVDDLRALRRPRLVSIPRIVTPADTARSQRRTRFAVAFSTADSSSSWASPTSSPTERANRVFTAVALALGRDRTAIGQRPCT